MADQKLTRITIVSSDKCKPKKCRQECKKSCPVVKTGQNPNSWISSKDVQSRSSDHVDLTGEDELFDDDDGTMLPDVRKHLERDPDTGLVIGY